MMALLFTLPCFAEQERAVISFYTISPDESDSTLESFTYFEKFSTGTRTVMVEDKVDFFESEINLISINYDQFIPNVYNINIKLRESGRQKIADYTERNLGREALLLSGPTVLANPVIRTHITGNTLQLSTPTLSIIYKLMELFDCKNNTSLRLPDELICVKNESSISLCAECNLKNPSDVATNFFFCVFSEKDFDQYVLPEHKESLEKLAEIFRTRYRECRIFIEKTNELPKKITRKFKGQNVPCPIYIKIEGDDFCLQESLILVIDNEGNLKVKGLTLY